MNGILILTDWVKAYSMLFDDFFPSARSIIQLTFLYAFACLDLIYNIVSYILSLGTSSNELLGNVYPFFEGILRDPTLVFLMSPEKVFLFSYLAIEVCIVQNTFRFTKLVRYHILLVYSLLMLQSTILSLWDLLFNRPLPALAAFYSWSDGFLTCVNQPLGTFFFTLTLFLYLFVYSYCYFCAYLGRFPTFPSSFQWITDSIAFWLRIRTDTMPYGKRKKRKQ